MPDAPDASTTTTSARSMVELKVSGHLMTLDPGLFCIVQTPSRQPDASNLPGVRLSVAPAERAEAVSIAAFRPDGWLSGDGDAALVRVSGQPAQILVTIYQSANAAEKNAPNIQVMRLIEGAAPGQPGARPPAARATAAPDQAAPQAARAPVPSGGGPAVMEMVAHIQELGDVGAMIGDWLGERGSGRWIEGFGISPTAGVSPRDIEYQAVLGPGWLSPWVEGGQFCGSRAMALPLLGLRVRLRGRGAEDFDVAYSATFTDGTEIGPATNGEPCESETLASMESFQVSLRPRDSQPLATAPAVPMAEARAKSTKRADPGRPAAPAPVRGAAPKGKAPARKS